MKYKLLSFALIFLIATPVFSQEISPLIVETPKTTTPTVVKTGEPFSQTYILRFIDLTPGGEEVLIKEELLNPGMLGDFEVLDFCIDKGQLIGRCAGLGGGTKQREFLEHIWYLKYTLRIIKPEKGAYKIPSITVPWIKKKIGQSSNDQSLKENKDIKTKEVNVNYVSTITRDPALYIRDEVNFGSFHKTAFGLRILFWLLLLVPLSIWMKSFIRFVKARRYTTVDTGQELYLHDSQESVSEGLARKVTKKKSLKTLRRNVKELGQCQGSVPVELEERLLVSLKNFLMTEFPGLNIGATPLEMSNYIESRFKNVIYGRAVVELSKKAVAYQSDLEGRSFRAIQSPVLESRDLKKMLDELRWYNRSFYRLLNLKSYLAGIFSRKQKV